MIFDGVYWIYKFERTKSKMSNFIKNVRYMTIENTRGEIKPVEVVKIDWCNVASIAMGLIVVAYIMFVWWG